MNAFEMVRQLKVRRHEILGLLPPNALEEFDRIEEQIRRIDEALRVKPTRTPLAQRREVLTEYLRVHGAATRAQILADTKIPPGTLSALLSEEVFNSTVHGTWKLRS